MINGQGVVGVPDLAGLPATYLFGEIKAFREGSRTSSQSGRLATSVMIRVAKSWPDADLRAAVAYYASLPRRTPIHSVETETAPSMRVERFGWTYVDAKHPQRQALKGAVAEAPESLARVFMYDPSDRQLVYVAKSTLMRGQSLVATGGGGGQPCSGCHGVNLHGGPLAPPLAGRDPSYLARQLWDIRSGARSGASAGLMRGPAEGLSARDVTAVAAYLASLKP
jgi:cytochrome c553